MICEGWLLTLRVQNKKNDRDLVQQLQTEVKHLKQDLGNASYRKDDILTDPAALKTELDCRERELSTKVGKESVYVQELLIHICVSVQLLDIVRYNDCNLWTLRWYFFL